MSDVWLGMTPPEDADRDATHVAVVPVIAATEMEPGTHCEVRPDGTATLGDDPIGIVDPFLKANVKQGQRFYLCLYPRTTVGLRHVYTHAVLDGHSAATSRKWIEDCAAGLGVTSEALMQHARVWVETHDDKWGGDYWVGGDEFEGVRVPEEFWEHYDRVKGVQTPEKMRANFISCAC